MMPAPPPGSSPSPDRLEADGWKRCFVADEPRLSEAIETYRELGFEVALAPVAAPDGECATCSMADPQRYRVIYVRRPPSASR
jgi:hypothetical protein